VKEVLSSMMSKLQTRGEEETKEGQLAGGANAGEVCVCVLAAEYARTHTYTRL
jgi:hypothetical protein